MSTSRITGSLDAQGQNRTGRDPAKAAPQCRAQIRGEGVSYVVGYGRGEVEPRIAPLVEAVQQSGFDTFSSCEGHIDESDSENLPRFTSVAFYAYEEQARRVHEFYLHYRDRLACSWCLTASFVLHKSTSQFALGWTLENCGLIEQVPFDEFNRRTVEAGWHVDIPLLMTMFSEIQESYR